MGLCAEGSRALNTLEVRTWDCVPRAFRPSTPWQYVHGTVCRRLSGPEHPGSKYMGLCAKGSRALNTLEVPGAVGLAVAGVTGRGRRNEAAAAAHRAKPFLDAPEDGSSE
eukprot:357787-Chlamydomonas_euryale.AAC.2